MAGGGTAALHWHGWGWRAVSWHEYVDCIKPSPHGLSTIKHRNTKISVKRAKMGNVPLIKKKSITISLTTMKRDGDDNAICNIAMHCI